MISTVEIPLAAVAGERSESGLGGRRQIHSEDKQDCHPADRDNANAL